MTVAAGTPRRFARLLLAALTLNGALVAATLARPQATFACSCDPTAREDIGRFKGEPDVAVFVGTVLSVPKADSFSRTVGELEVELVFQGDLWSRMLVVSGGWGDCTMRLEAGQDMIAAALFDGSRITPSICLPYADPDTKKGRALFAATEEVFGAGVRPPAGPPTDTDLPASTSDSPGREPPPIIVSVLGLVFGFLGAIAALSRRRTDIT